MYDSLAITIVSLCSATPSARNSSPQCLSQAKKDDTISVDKFPQGAGRELVGILIGLRCRLELFLGACFRIAQCSSRFCHHRRLEIVVSSGTTSTVDFGDEPPFQAMLQERNIHRGLGDERGNHVFERRTLRLQFHPERGDQSRCWLSEGGPQHCRSPRT